MHAAIIYFTKSGNTLAAARLIEEGLREGGIAEVTLIPIEEVEANRAVIAAANTLVFGTPTYSASFAWPLKQWFDEHARTYGLEGKLAANFATAMHIGGGSDTALASLAMHELMRGMLIYSGGGPLTHYGAVLIGTGDAAQQARAREFGRRIGRKAQEIFVQNG